MATRSTDRLRAAGKSTVRSAAIATSRWREGPDLVIIGVKRGGTTSLFRDLERHPAWSPLVPSARRLPLRENQKGVHYFDTNHDRGTRWYRSHFPTRLTRRSIRRRVGTNFSAEASPYYFFHPLAARRAALELPDTTFMVQLRDPVERTVSHWAEQTRNDVETLTLADALAAENERIGDDAERLRSGEIARSRAHEQQSYAAQSEYADSLQRWFDAAGRDRVLVAFAEDYYRDPVSVISVVTDRMGIPAIGADAVGTRRNAAPRTPIDPELEDRLVDRFAPDVDRVADLLRVRPPWVRFGCAR